LFSHEPSTFSDHVREGKKSKLGCRNYSREKVAEIFLKRSGAQSGSVQAQPAFFCSRLFFLCVLPLFSTFLLLIYRINVAGHDAPFSASAHSIGLLQTIEFQKRGAQPSVLKCVPFFVLKN